MKVVLQRVRSASVEVEGKSFASIGFGLLLLVGIAKDDDLDDVEFLAPVYSGDFIEVFGKITKA